MSWGFVPRSMPRGCTIVDGGGTGEEGEEEESEDVREEVLSAWWEKKEGCVGLSIDETEEARLVVGTARFGSCDGSDSRMTSSGFVGRGHCGISWTVLYCFLKRLWKLCGPGGLAGPLELDRVGDVWGNSATPSASMIGGRSSLDTCSWVGVTSSSDIDERRE